MTQCIRACLSCFNRRPSSTDDEEELAGSSSKATLLHRFKRVNVLENGSFGQVWKVIDKQTNQNLAFKIFKDSLLGESNSPEVEYQIHKDCSNHPNVIKALEFYKNRDRKFMSMEIGRIDLFDWLKSEKHPLSEARIYSIFNQVVASVLHLHSKKIIHRDIKPENYILMDDNKTIKLTDFGFAKRIDGKNPHTPRGTDLYRSPEMVKRLSFDWASDHWSMGALLYFLAYFAQVSDSGMKCNIRQSPPLFPRYRTSELEDLIEKLLNQDPDQRLGKGDPCCQEILDHPWMKKYSSLEKP